MKIHQLIIHRLCGCMVLPEMNFIVVQVTVSVVVLSFTYFCYNAPLSSLIKVFLSGQNDKMHLLQLSY